MNSITEAKLLNGVRVAMTVRRRRICREFQKAGLANIFHAGLFKKPVLRKRKNKKPVQGHDMLLKYGDLHLHNECLPKLSMGAFVEYKHTKKP